MVYIILALAALAAAEAAVVLGVLAVWLWRDVSPGRRGRKTEDAGDGGEEFEKRWQEGMNSVMGYDLGAARRAVRRDKDEE